MDIFWLLNSPLYPELRRLEGRAARRSALARAVSNRATLWAVLPAAAVPTLVMATFFSPLNAPWGVRFVLFLGVQIASIYMAMMLTRRWSRRSLWKIMREYGVVLCLECGFDLRGQTKPRCPECGTEFDEYYLCAPSERTDTKDS